MSENNEPPVIEGSAGEPPSERPLPAAMAEVGRIPRAQGALMPLPAEQVVEGMRAYQKLLKELLEPSDWQTHDKDGNRLPKPFLKKSGWRKISRAFNLSFARVHSRVERDEHGTPVRAEVWMRAVAPNGQYGDGDGYCSADEGRFRSWKGRQKLENDLRATATTRAKNRAIADLVGMGEVSFEEIAPAGEEDEHARALAAGAPASDELARRAFAALAQVLGNGEPDREAAKRVGERIAQDHGYLPVAAGRALCYAATARRATRPKDEPPTDPPATDGAAAAGDDVDEEDYRQQATAVLELAHQGGYRQATLRALCQLVYRRDRIEQLGGLDLLHLGELLRTAMASGTDDDTLSRAVERAAAHEDRETAGAALRRWLAERSQSDRAEAA